MGMGMGIGTERGEGLESTINTSSVARNTLAIWYLGRAVDGWMVGEGDGDSGGRKTGWFF